jgi:acyl-CoA thioesterase
VTSEYKINYLRPAIGHKLVASAWVEHEGKNQAVCRCEITAIDGKDQKIVALALGTIIKIRQGND